MRTPQKLTEAERLDALATLLAQGAYRWILQQQRRRDAIATEKTTGSTPVIAGAS